MDIKSSVSSVSLRLKIPNISKLTEVWSPEFIVQGAPWRFLVKKTSCDAKHFLGAYVYCKNVDSVVNWSYAAAALFKLLPFGDGLKLVDHVHPFVFDQMESGFGVNAITAWDDLFDVNKNYVKDDTINLELKIDVADPFDRAISKMKFGRQSDTKFRLLVNNINNLMAARSPPFMLQKLPFNLVVYKSHLSHLGVYLYQRGAACDIPSIITMSATLISLSNCARIEKSITDTMDNGTLNIDGLTSWDVLLDSRSGFINNNNVIIEVELTCHKL